MDKKDFSKCRQVTTCEAVESEVMGVWELKNCTPCGFHALKSKASFVLDVGVDELGGEPIRIRFYFKDYKYEKFHYDYLNLTTKTSVTDIYSSLCMETLGGNGSLLMFKIKVDDLNENKGVSLNRLKETLVSVTNEKDRQCKILSHNFLHVSRYSRGVAERNPEEGEFLISKSRLLFGITVKFVKVESVQKYHLPENRDFPTERVKEKEWIPFDVRLQSKDHFVLYAHKSLLAAKSPVLKSLMLAETREGSIGTVKLSKIKYRPLHMILHWIYTNEINESGRVGMMEVLETANLLKMKGFIEFMDAKLVTICNEENMMQLYDVARQYDLLNALTHIRNFIRRNI